MSLFRNSCCGLLVFAVLAGVATGEPSAFIVRAGEQAGAPATGPTMITVSPGETVDLEAWLADAAPLLLGSYQVVVDGVATPTAGSQGTIEYLDTPGIGGSVDIDMTRPDWALAGIPGVSVFFSELPLPDQFGFIAFNPGLGNGNPVTLGYLGEFQFTVSANACGTHTLDLVPLNAPSLGGTQFVNENGDVLIPAVLRQLIIEVNGDCNEACCQPTGGCVDRPAGLCTVLGGNPQGPGTTCANTPCTQPEACCFGDGACDDLDADDCTAQGGTPQGADTSCAADGCPAAPVIVHATGQPGETQPCSGYIDPKRESSNGTDVNLGLQEITLVFSMPVFSIGGGPVGASDFVVTETGGGTPPGISSVDASANPLIHLEFDRPITLQEWTTTRAIVQNAGGVQITDMGDLGSTDEPDRHDVGMMPCDVDQDEACGPFDLLRFRQLVNQIATPDCGVLLDFLDIDRDGSVGPFDLLAFRQLVNGVPPATQPWANTSMNNTRP